ncbi:ABC transporter ATP-binding protein [Marinicrinis lubricantis]|uniref:ABC transporter ATP-binding protein n=1 Tax=Marinicrinis lubricantis TaxID=2086470 RepID=A0ABW1IPY7_9BACL
MGKTGKRLFQYAALYKKTIIFALVLLTASICTELAGPFIAKQIIDKSILGIEEPWYEVQEKSSYSVSYQGKLFIRADRLDEGQTHGREVRVLQVGRDYYFLDEALAFDGNREVSGNQLVITSDGQRAEYTVEKLSRGELFAFYKPEVSSIVMLAAIYFGLLIISALFAYGQRYMLQLSANSVIRKMRNDVFSHIHTLPVRYFDNLPAGKVVSRVTNDTEAIREFYVAVLANFFSGILYIAAIFGALYLLDPVLALIALPLVPLLYIWIVIYRKYASKYNKIIRARVSDINGMINESIQGMPIIQAFRRQKETMSEFEEINEEHFKYQNKMQSLNAYTTHNLANVLRSAIFILVIWLFFGDTLGDLITVGVLYAFVDYINRMFQPIVGIVNQLSNLETALVSADRVFELMDEPGTDVVNGQMSRYNGNVKFEHVSFAYKEGEYVLNDINFEAKHGETVALVGHTGSGKSSILNLLFRFYDVEEGKIIVDGKDVRDVPVQLLRQHMGIVLQDPFLFTGSIASNISLNDPSITRDKIEKALKDVGAYEMFSNLPGGLDEPVVEKGSTLSAGQRQLISFARALAFNPSILILDEATASIDTETESIIQDALDVLKQGRTTFVIAHRLSTIRSADQILVLDHGVIVERGNHEELMKLQGKYYQMYQLQKGESLEMSSAGALPVF